MANHIGQLGFHLAQQKRVVHSCSFWRAPRRRRCCKLRRLVPKLFMRTRCLGWRCHKLQRHFLRASRRCLRQLQNRKQLNVKSKRNKKREREIEKEIVSHKPGLLPRRSPTQLQRERERERDLALFNLCCGCGLVCPFVRGRLTHRLHQLLRGILQTRQVLSKKQSWI